MTLTSTDPLAAPAINPNLLGSNLDLSIMREAVKSALRFTTASAWAGYVISPVGVNSSNTDAELDEYIRGNTISLGHAAGTASMSPKGATWGVVDPDLRIKGLVGIRIIDLSVVVSH